MLHLLIDAVVNATATRLVITNLDDYARDLADTILDTIEDYTLNLNTMRILCSKWMLAFGI